MIRVPSLLLSLALLSSISIGQGSDRPELFQVLSKGKTGFIDKSGKIVFTTDFEVLGDFHDGVCRVRVETTKKIGFIDQTGKIVIEARYSSASDFSEGLAAVFLDEDLFGYIDTAGRMVIEPQFHGVGKFSDGLARIGEDGKHGYIDKAGKIAIPKKFDQTGDFTLMISRTAWRLSSSVASGVTSTGAENS